jgi:type II site-specific deoxyribonuclease
MYHFALSELVEATRASRNAEAMKTLDNLINGQRLRDIADLPLDLAI